MNNSHIILTNSLLNVQGTENPFPHLNKIQRYQPQLSDLASYIERWIPPYFFINQSPQPKQIGIWRLTDLADYNQKKSFRDYLVRVIPSNYNSSSRSTLSVACLPAFGIASVQQAWLHMVLDVQKDSRMIHKQMGHIFFNTILPQLKTPDHYPMLVNTQAWSTRKAIETKIDFFQKAAQIRNGLANETINLFPTIAKVYVNMLTFDEALEQVKEKYTVYKKKKDDLLEEEIIEAQTQFLDAFNFLQEAIVSSVSRLDVGQFIAFNLGGGSDHDAKILIKRTLDDDFKPQFTLVLIETGLNYQQMNEIQGTEEEKQTFLEVVSISEEDIKEEDLWSSLILQQMDPATEEEGLEMIQRLKSLGVTKKQHSMPVSYWRQKSLHQQAPQLTGVCAVKSLTGLERYLFFTELKDQDLLFCYTQFKLSSALKSFHTLTDIIQDDTYDQEGILLSKLRSGWKSRYIHPEWKKCVEDSLFFIDQKTKWLDLLHKTLGQITPFDEQESQTCLEKLEKMAEQPHPFFVLNDFNLCLADCLKKSSQTLTQLQDLFATLPSVFDPAQSLYLEHLMIRNLNGR